MNSKVTDIILKLFDAIKIFLPTLSAIYLLTWIILLKYEGLFNILNKLFHFLPDIFNNTFGVTAEMLGRDIPMGYAHASLFTIIVFLIFCKFEKMFKGKIRDIDFAIAENKPKKKQKTVKPKTVSQPKIKQEPKNPTNIEKTTNVNQDITAFYGLLTFELKQMDDNPLDIETQKTIKHNYTKILVEKLKEKYDSINYAVSDKVFFICNNVSLFNLFVRDVVKLNKIIAQISEKSGIKTALKVCFWSNPKANPKQACAILLRINQMNYLNKVIVSKQIQLKFDKQLIKCFDFCSLGTVKLTKLNPKDKEIDMELFYLKTMDD